MLPVRKSLGAVVIEQVPADEHRFEHVERVALADAVDDARAEFGAELHPVFGMGLAGALAGADDPPLGLGRISEPAHGIVVTLLTSVIFPRPASVESYRYFPLTA